MAEQKVRMGRNDETDFQGHTIVGGRPAGNQDLGTGVPRGMELLIKKAAVDAEFFKKLLARRANVAEELGMALDPTEHRMLETIPEAQLKTIVQQTNVPQSQRSVFLGTSVAAMMALVTQLTFCPVPGRAEEPAGARQSSQQSDNPHDFQSGGGARPNTADFPMPPGGCRPDRPDDRPLVPPILSNMPNPTIKGEYANKLFLETIDELKKETGLSIEVETPSGMFISWPALNSTADRGLVDVLNRLAAEADRTRYSHQLVYEKEKIILRFIEKTNLYEHQSKGHRPEMPEGVTRGIRPEMPGENLQQKLNREQLLPASDGHRPDMPKKNNEE